MNFMNKWLKAYPANSKVTATCAALCCAAVLVLSVTACKEDKAGNKNESARFLKSAEAYYDQGQLNAAMLETKNAIQKNPNEVQAYKLLSKIYAQLGATGSTQKLLETVVKKMPEVSLNLAESYLANKKYRTALNIATEYNTDKLSLDEQAQKQIIIARSSIYLGDTATYNAAIETLKKLNAKQEETLQVEAESLMAQGQLEKAQVVMAELEEKYPNSVRSLILVGSFALSQNKAEKAEETFTKALSILPKTDVFTVDKTIILSQLTEALIREGRSGEAYRYQKILAEANPEGHAAQEKFDDAMELYRQGKFTEAEKALTEIRQQFPQDKNTAMLLGLVQYQQGQNKEATALFDQYIDPETATPTIIQAAALAKFRTNKSDEAMALLKKSVDSQPENPTILATYGLALLDANNTSEEGQKALEKSLAINPKQQRLRLALAKRYFVLKNNTQALGQLQKAYEEDPLDFVIQQTYFKALFADKKIDIVKSEIEKFQKANPTNARGSFLTGWLKFVEKDYPAAQQAFEKALSMKSNTEKNLSYAGLAEVYKVQNQPQKAVAVWQNFLDEDQTAEAAYGEWLRLMQGLNQGKEAVTFLLELEKKSDKWQPSAVLAQVYYLQGQLPDAVKHIETALERSGRSEQVKKIAANLYHQSGYALLKENKPADAKAAILKAMSFYPDNMNFVASLIELEISQKNIVEAQKVLDQVSTTTDVSAEKAYLQAIIRSAENKPDEAFLLYKDSWSKKPMDSTAEVLLTYYKKNGQLEKMDSFLTEWAEKMPQSGRPALMLAVKAQERKDIPTAIKWYEKTIELMPKAAAAMNNLAWIYYEQKNPKALALAESAYKLEPKNPSIADTYAWILVENNRAAEAVPLLEAAAAAMPKSKEIQDHLATAKAKAKK